MVGAEEEKGGPSSKSATSGNSVGKLQPSLQSAVDARIQLDELCRFCEHTVQEVWRFFGDHLAKGWASSRESKSANLRDACRNIFIHALCPKPLTRASTGPSGILVGNFACRPAALTMGILHDVTHQKKIQLRRGYNSRPHLQRLGSPMRGSIVTVFLCLKTKVHLEVLQEGVKSRWQPRKSILIGKV